VGINFDFYDDAIEADDGARVHARKHAGSAAGGRGKVNRGVKFFWGASNRCRIA
jgi:hypothetical protein